MADIEAEIAQLRADLHATSDSELAGMLGLGRSAISQWRKRGVIPENALVKAAQAAAHLRDYAYAARQVAGLSNQELAYARALAVAFIYRQAESGMVGLEFELPRLTAAFDAITIAATRAMRETGLDQLNAFGTVLLEDNLARAMMKALLPTLLPQ